MRAAQESVGVSGDKQFLAFTVGSEEYAVDLLKVQEIRCCGPITPLPNTLPYVEGVMNLRGVVIPVINLRKRFALTSATGERPSVIIVVFRGAQTMGLAVDGVSDVLQVAVSEIQPAPDGLMGCDLHYVGGIVRVSSRLVVLLELEHVLPVTEVADQPGEAG